jgi:hypothetical protein
MLYNIFTGGIPMLIELKDHMGQPLWINAAMVSAISTSENGRTIVRVEPTSYIVTMPAHELAKVVAARLNVAHRFGPDYRR